MQEYKLQKCIQELNKPNKNRNQEIIIDYLKSLVPFMNLVNEKNEYSEEIINKISKIMRYQKNIKNDLIIQYGDKGNDFYIILKGFISILVPKYSIYYMDEEEFILHLLKLRQYNQNELIIQCLRQNALIFSIPTERFDDLLFDLQNKNKKRYFFKKSIIKKAKEVYEYINNHINNKNIKNISPEDYIALLEVDEAIKKNTYKLTHLNKLNIDFDKKDEDKKLTKIPNYVVVSKFGTGETFGELALEHLNKKRMATIITLSDCHFAVIDKREYNELIKDSVNKSKNKFYNLIYTYKIFDSISYMSFDKKYYNYFRYLKMKQNEILFNEGDSCDEVYFILNGEYELFVDKNIFEINQMILKLIIIVDELKKIIIKEYKNIEKINLKNNKNKSFINLKNNLNLFFNKFENEINLEQVSYIIKNKDIINKHKFLGDNFFKTVSDKKRIRLGIYKSKQIIGLADTINRFFGDTKCFFNCKCFSFSGELYYIKYKEFSSMYEQEENVKLYTSEFLYQNLYYIIGRLLSHKKFIYEKANKKENDFFSLLHSEENSKNNNNYDKHKIKKNSINLLINKIKNSSLINEKNKINNKINIFKFISSEKNLDTKYIINDLRPQKNNLNILKNINLIKTDNNYNSFSDTKRNENNNNEYYYNNFNTSSRSNNNNLSGVESYILSNGKKKIKNINNIQSQKILKKNITFNYKNLLSDSKIKSKNLELEKKNEFPVLVINDKEVKINENSISKKYIDKNNYRNILKPIDSKNKKLIELINSKEVKNMVIYSDHNDYIEMHQKLKHLRKKKGLLLSRNYNTCNIKTISKEDIKTINNYFDKKQFYSTISYKKNSPEFLSYNLSDINGNHLKQIKLKINESSKTPTYNNKKNLFHIGKGGIKKLKKLNKFRQSLTHRNFASYNY